LWRPVTWAFWLSITQVKRRAFLTASSTSGHSLRTSARFIPLDPPAGATPTGPASAVVAGTASSARGADRPESATEGWDSVRDGWATGPVEVDPLSLPAAC
jgi:hypothetical protein